MFNAIRVGDEALMIKRRNKILIGITAYIVSHVQRMQCDKRIRLLVLRIQCAQLFTCLIVYINKGNLPIKKYKICFRPARSFITNTLDNL